MRSRANGSGEHKKSEDLLRKLSEEVEANLRNEQFSVENLAARMGMNRSHLHRKLQQASGQSISQFIREYRLQRAKELLEKGNMTVSEVSYEVGFGSPSYFTSCFTEYYGYNPGEAKYKVREINLPQELPGKPEFKIRHRQFEKIWIGSLTILGLLIAFLVYQPSVVDSYDSEESDLSYKKSIVVLPFKNLSTNPENAYFSEGVVGAITRHLSSIGDLKVISRTSADRYQESSKSAQEIAHELRVSNLLEGSIQRFENTVRIEVRLIDAQSESQLWAANYDRELQDLLKVQSEIAEKVATALQAELSAGEKSMINQAVTDNTEAYDLYLKGIYEARTYSRKGNQRSVKYFQQAIALDPDFALAYSGLAGSFINKASIFSAEMGALEAFALAKPLLDKALSIDPELPEAHTWRGFYCLYNDWDFEGAEHEYQKAIVHDNSDALALYADFLHFVRRHQEGLAIAKKLNQVDPYYPASRMVFSLYYTKQYEAAGAFAETRLSLLNHYNALDSYGFLMLNTGYYEKAIEFFQRTIDLEGIRYPRMLGWMGAAHARLGQQQEAQTLIDELKTKNNKTGAGSTAFFIAVIYAALGDKDSALDWLQRSYDYHEMEIPWLISEPQLYALHQEPEFVELRNKVGFP